MFGVAVIVDKAAVLRRAGMYRVKCGAGHKHVAEAHFYFMMSCISSIRNDSHASRIAQMFYARREIKLAS